MYTVSGEVIHGGQVLFDEGRVVAVGKSVQAPSDVKRIDVAGKRVYPGLFASGNDLGLVEIRSVRGTTDAAETGELNPNIRAEVAINPDSELIPVTRANGVLLNLTLPEGSILPGSCAVLQLDGWTWQDLTLKAPAAIHVTWPSMGRQRARCFASRTTSRRREADEQLKALDQAFADARAYLSREEVREKGGSRRPVGGDGPAAPGRTAAGGHGGRTAPDPAAVAFAQREKVKLVILGGYDAPLCADLLKKYDVPVIVNGIHRLPLRPDAPYDEPFTVPNRLREAGVRFCITLSHRFGGSDVRNLPYHAATAAAHGLPADEALKSITLYPAQILGCRRPRRLDRAGQGRDADRDRRRHPRNADARRAGVRAGAAGRSDQQTHPALAEVQGEIPPPRRRQTQAANTSARSETFFSRQSQRIRISLSSRPRSPALESSTTAGGCRLASFRQFRGSDQLPSRAWRRAASSFAGALGAVDFCRSHARRSINPSSSVPHAAPPARHECPGSGTGHAAGRRPVDDAGEELCPHPLQRP